MRTYVLHKYTYVNTYNDIVYVRISIRVPHPTLEQN